jgi:hypothetical protein
MSMKIISITLLLAGFASGAFAQNSTPQSGDMTGQRRGPPPQAIAACKNKTVGDACNFVGRRNNPLTGTCFSPPARPADASTSNTSPRQGERFLACRPNRKGQSRN